MEAYLTSRKLPDLKVIATSYQIPKRSNVNKAPLISLIIKHIRSIPGGEENFLNIYVEGNTIASPSRGRPPILSSPRPVQPTIPIPTVTTPSILPDNTSSCIPLPFRAPTGHDQPYFPYDEVRPHDPIVVPVPPVTSTQLSIPNAIFDDYVAAQEIVYGFHPPNESENFLNLFNPEYMLAFVDNTSYIYKTFSKNPNKTVRWECKKLLVRPHRFGKTTFGRLWLEFLKGNKELLKNTDIIKNYNHLAPIPKPNEYVCVHLELKSKGNIIVHIIDSMNDALKEALLPGFDCKGTVDDVIDSFTKILEDNKRKAAIFIDEYDGLIRSARPENYNNAYDITESIFSCLKASIDNIPLVLATGSSRVSFTNNLSGGNDVFDVTYIPEWALCLGYTWEQIENIYSVQLRMLEKIYGDTPEKFKKRVEFWYDGYFFSPSITPKIFCTWSINQLIKFGKFEPYLTYTGLSKTLITGEFSKETIELITKPDMLIPTSIIKVKKWRYTGPCEAEDPFSTYMQLLNAGILTFLPDETDLHMKVPNEDAFHALTSVILSFAKGINVDAFDSLINANKIVEAVYLIRNSLRDLALDTAKCRRKSGTLEECHLQQAFFSLLESIRMQLRGDSSWFQTSETRVENLGKSDFVFYTMDRNERATSHIVEFGVTAYTSPTPEAIQTSLSSKLFQTTKYMYDFVNPDVTAFIFSPTGEIVASGGPYLAKDVIANVNAIRRQTWTDYYDTKGNGVKIFHNQSC